MADFNNPTIEQYSEYLPYGAHVFCGKIAGMELTYKVLGLTPNYLFTEIEPDGNHATMRFENFPMPLILRPLSDLTEEMEHKGKKIVPLRELAILNDPDISSPIITNYDNSKFVARYVSERPYMGNCVYEFSYLNEKQCFALCNASKNIELRTFRDLQMFRKLREWMFDLDGLIESGKAVNVHDLETNPFVPCPE